MVERKAIVPKDNDHQTFAVDFAIVKKEFPSQLHEMVLTTLNKFEQQLYLEGVMAFTVLDNGFLSWKPTGKML